MRNRIVIVLLLVATSIGIVWYGIATRRGATRMFPKTGAWDRIGVFIGINAYEKLESKHQLKGAVADAKRMHAVMRDRFGFERSAMLLDAEATRAGIERVFQELVEQVRMAQEHLAGAAPIVVIFYAGHGSRVEDQDGDENAGSPDLKDNLDETWIPYDGTFAGRNDIRDDDVESVLAELAAAGARVVLISDSCHSGSIDRDPVRARAPTGWEESKRGAGPPTPIFSSDKPVSTSHVTLTACDDRQKAAEDDDGGYFTTAMIAAMKEADSCATFEQVFSDAARRLAKRRQPHLQRPRLRGTQRTGGLFARHGENEAENEYGSILAIDGATVRINRGTKHGLSAGARVEFYRDVISRCACVSPLAVGRVESVDEHEAQVALSSSVTLPATALARLDRVQVAPLAVHWRTASAAPGHLSIPAVTGSDPHVFALARKKTDVEVFARGGSTPILTVAEHELGKRLRTLAIIHQIDSLRRNERLIDLEVLQVQSLQVADGSKQLVAQVATQLRRDDRVQVVMRNTSGRALYPYVFALIPKSGESKAPWIHINAMHSSEDVKNRGGKAVAKHGEVKFDIVNPPVGVFGLKLIFSERNVPRPTNPNDAAAFEAWIREILGGPPTGTEFEAWWGTASAVLDVQPPK